MVDCVDRGKAAAAEGNSEAETGTEIGVPGEKNGCQPGNPGDIDK